MTGLDYFNARYYDPLTGQFLSADVVQGNAQGTSPYMYVAGNPETRTDPTGQMITCGSCGSSGPPNANDCAADPSLSGCSTPASQGDDWEHDPSINPVVQPTHHGGTTTTKPNTHKKSVCSSTCLNNGHRWLDFLSRVLILIGGGTALAATLADLIKWIGIGVSALLEQGWALVVDAILHVARDAISAIVTITTFLGLPQGGWMGFLRGAGEILDIVTPFVDIGAFLLGFFSAPLKAIAGRIFNNNPIINLMAKWGTAAIVKTIVKWSLQQNAPWIEQGIGLALSGASPSILCNTISAACENAPPSWVQ